MANHRLDSSSFLTVHQLLHSDLIGIWKDRDDLDESTTYARQLRDQAWKR